MYFNKNLVEESNIVSDSVKRNNLCETNKQDVLKAKLFSLKEIHTLKEKECQEVTSLAINFFEENIRLERELNKTKTEYDLLLIDFKQLQEKIISINNFHQIDETTSNKLENKNENKNIVSEQKKAKFNQKNKFFFDTPKKKPSNLSMIIKSKIKKSNNYYICSKIRKIYETKIIEVLKSARKDLAPLFLTETVQNTQNCQVQKLDSSTQTLESNFFQIQKCQTETFYEFFFDIDIIEHNADKKLIKLINRTNKEIFLGNCQLVSYLNGIEMLRYKFHKSTTIKPIKSINLWSKLSEFKKHYPPSDFIMNDFLNKENINTEKSIWSFSGSNELIIDVILDENEKEISRSEFFIKSK